MNGYARLSHVRADIAGVSGTTSLDDSLLRAIDEVSTEFEKECGNRKFYSYQGVRLYDGPRRAQRELWLPDDLISASAVEVDWDGDGTMDLVLSAATDYWLYPDNADQLGIPYHRIDLQFWTPQIFIWPSYRRCVRVTGLWGYSNETEATGVTTDGAVDASQTTITVTPDPSSMIDVGETIPIDSEQMYVSAIAGSSITVTRAINGTTAATHDSGTAIYRRRYPRDIEMAVAERVVGMRWDSQGGYSTAATLIGDATGAARASTIRASYARWRRTAERYSLPVVA